MAASIPNETARCVFPTPEFPTNTIFSLFSIKDNELNSLIWFSLTEGWNEKSYSSNVFLNGKFALFIIPSAARLSLYLISSSLHS